MIALLLALSLLQDDRFRELEELRRAAREKKAESERLAKTSHEALDRGEYEKAVADHRRSRTLATDVETLVLREKRLVERAAESLVKDLASDDVDIRDKASSRILLLGPGALAVLEKALEEAGRNKAKEVEARLNDLIPLVRLMDMDNQGRIRQWAVGARASSEYTAAAWSAAQATGKPDTAAAGDSQSAWATLLEDAAEEWLELTYRHAVVPREIRIHETFNPGAIVKIEAQDADGKWHALWTGRERTEEKIRWFAPAIQAPAFGTRAIRISLDSAGVPGWNEIDAVELVGEATLQK